MANVKGITIEIGANTTKLQSELNKVNSQAKDISKDLKTVSESLKLGSGADAGKVADKLNLLKEAAGKAEEKVKLLKSAQEQLSQKIKDGGGNTDKYKEQLGNVEKALASAKREQELASDKVKEFAENADDAGESSSRFGDILKASLASSAIQKAASVAKEAFSAVVGAVKEAATALKDYAVEAVDMAASYEDALGYSEQVFKENSDSVKKWVEDNSLALRANKADVLEMVNTFGSLFVATGTGADKATEMSESLVKLAADMHAATGIPLDQVFQNLQSVMNGGAEAGYKYGLVIKETNVQAKALSMGLAQVDVDQEEVTKKAINLEKAQAAAAEALQKHGEGSLEYRDAVVKVTSAEEGFEKAMEGKTLALTDAQKQEARYALIMEQSAAMQGQATRESGNYKSQLDLLKTVFDNLKISIGEKLLPVFNSLVTKFNEFVQSDEGQDFLNGIVEKIGEFADKITAFVTSGGLDEFIDKVKQKLPEVLETFGTILSKVWDAAKAVADFWNQMEYGNSEESRHAYLKVEGDVKEFAASMGLYLNEAKGYIEDFAIDNKVKLEDVYGNWDEYEPQIAAYMADHAAQVGYLNEESKAQMTDWSEQNNLKLQDVQTAYETWSQTMQEDQTKANEDLAAFAENNGLKLDEVQTKFEGWKDSTTTTMTTAATNIGAKTDEVETAVGDMKNNVTADADGMATGLQEGANKAGNINTSGMESKVSWIEALAGKAKAAWDTFLSAFNGAQNSSSYSANNVPNEYRGRWAGGSVSAGVPYKVGEHGWEVFVPDVSGTILNQQQLQQITNQSTNNSRTFSGGINIYISGGASADQVAEEIGAKVYRELRLRGAW